MEGCRRGLLLRLEAGKEGGYTIDYFIGNARLHSLLQVLRSLRTLREKNDARGLLGVLETCVRTNFAGIESSRCVSGCLGLIRLIHSLQTV